MVPALTCTEAGEIAFGEALEGCESSSSLMSVTCISFEGGSGTSGTASGTNGSAGFGAGTVGAATGGSNAGFGFGANTGGTGVGFGATSGTAGSGTGGRPDAGPVTPFCGSCTTNLQCGPPNACIVDGSGEQVCGQDCAHGQPCPPNSTCEMTTGLHGRMVTQCVPESCDINIADGG
jgi:hypothetical protein